MFRALDEKVSVAGQIGVADVAEAARLGFTTIVNNRPDGEEPGQPDAAAIGAAAAAAGIDYRHIPIAQGGFGPEQVAAMADALARAGGPLLAFCRSGTRSTFLWALAENSRGADGATLAAKARAAGYDLSPLREHLGA